MNFKKLEITDKAIFDEFFLSKYSMSSVHDFATVYLWNSGSEYYTDYKCLILRKLIKGRMYYHMPLVKNGGLKEGFKLIKSDIKNNGDYIIAQITEDDISEFINKDCDFLKDAVLDRDMSDYIYSAQDLITLVGKKYHAKRNHINKFTARYDYSFRELDFASKSDRENVLSLYNAWLAQAKQDESFELIALNRALDCYKDLNLKGGVIEIDGKMKAFSIISKSVHNIGQVQFEKADISFDGIYAAINNFTAKSFFEGCEYINRQEDMGIEGLRKSKLSYNPHRILLKYYYDGKTLAKL